MASSLPPRPRNTCWRRLLALLLCLPLVHGCAIKLVYGQLDWIIPWYVDDYLDLDRRQEALFRDLLADYLDWHRETQLPAWAAFLRQIARQAEDGLDQAELAAIQARSESFTRTLVSAMGPPLETLFATLDDGQVAHLMRKFAEDNADYRRESIEVPERELRKTAVKDVRREVVRWVGSLSDAQALLIEDWGEHYQPMPSAWLEARERWQQALAAALAHRRDDPERFRGGLLGLMEDTAYGRSAAFEAGLARNRSALLALHRRLDASLTAEQRSHFIATLREYAEELEALARE